MNENKIFLLLPTTYSNSGLGVIALPQGNFIGLCNPNYILPDPGVNSMFIENPTSLYNPIVSDPHIITTDQKMEVVPNTNPPKSSIDNDSEFNTMCSNLNSTNVVALESTVPVADSLKPLKKNFCAACNKTFSNNSKLRRHLAVHSNKRPYICQVCSKAFKLPNNLKIHMVWHINQEVKRDATTTSEPRIIAIPGPKVIPRSSKSVSESNLNDTIPKLTKSTLSELTVAKIINGSYYCNICNNDYPDRFMFRNHLKFHRDQPCNSEIDLKSFQHDSQHEKSDTKIIKRNRESLLKVYPCTICSKVFLTTNELNRHSKRHNKKSVFCSICGLDCKFKSQLKTHMIVHDKSNRIEYICDICGKSVTSLKSLKEHKLWHTGVKPHQCEVCGKCFAKRTNLQVHIRSHTGVKPHRCKLCEKSFTQRPTLTIHMRYHTGERPYACDICSNTFVSRSLLNIHKKSKHQLMH